MNDMKWQRREFLQRAVLAFTGISLLLVIQSPLGLASGSGPEGAWDKMTEAEQAVIEKRWQSFQAMSPDVRAELRRGLERYKALNGDEKKQVDKAFGRWKALSADKRATLQKKFLKWKDLTAEEKQKIRVEVRKAMVDTAK